MFLPSLGLVTLAVLGEGINRETPHYHGKLMWNLSAIKLQHNVLHVLWTRSTCFDQWSL